MFYIMFLMQYTDTGVKAEDQKATALPCDIVTLIYHSCLLVCCRKIVGIMKHSEYCISVWNVCICDHQLTVTVTVADDKSNNDNDNNDNYNNNNDNNNDNKMQNLSEFIKWY